MKKCIVTIAILALASIMVADVQAGIFGRLFRRRRAYTQNYVVYETAPVVVTEPEPKEPVSYEGLMPVSYNLFSRTIDYMLL